MVFIEDCVHTKRAMYIPGHFAYKERLLEDSIQSVLKNQQQHQHYVLIGLGKEQSRRGGVHLGHNDRATTGRNRLSLILLICLVRISVIKSCLSRRTTCSPNYLAYKRGLS